MLPMTQQIAELVGAFERQRTGQAPRSLSVVLSDNRLMITLPGNSSDEERRLMPVREKSAELQERLQPEFSRWAAPLREEIRRITGVPVRDAVTEVEPETGRVVQVFLLAHGIGGTCAANGHKTLS